MEDQLIVTDIITTEKCLAKLYMSGILESTCNKMRESLNKSHMQLCALQYMTFEYMNGKGWYPIENAPEQKFQQTVNMFSKPLE